MKDVMMRSLKCGALALGLGASVVTCGAQVRAQEFTIAEVTSAAGLGVDQLKPKTIAFLDRPSEELVDPDAGLIRFEDWAQAKPVEKQFLSPFPSYVEPYSEVAVDGADTRNDLFIFDALAGRLVHLVELDLRPAPGSREQLNRDRNQSEAYLPSPDRSRSHRLISSGTTQFIS